MRSVLLLTLLVTTHAFAAGAQAPDSSLRFRRRASSSTT